MAFLHLTITPAENTFCIFKTHAHTHTRDEFLQIVLTFSFLQLAAGIRNRLRLISVMQSVTSFLVLSLKLWNRMPCPTTIPHEEEFCINQKT